MKFSPFQAFFPLCFPYELNSTNSLIVGGWGGDFYGLGLVFFVCVSVQYAVCGGFFVCFFLFPGVLLLLKMGSMFLGIQLLFVRELPCQLSSLERRVMTFQK